MVSFLGSAAPQPIPRRGADTSTGLLPLTGTTYSASVAHAARAGFALGPGATIAMFLPSGDQLKPKLRSRELGRSILRPAPSRRTSQSENRSSR